MDSPPEDFVSRFLRLIRFSHTIFALPFALGALLVAANGRPTARLLILVVTCMVLARTAAMLFNRLVDWSIDQRNPRTVARHHLVNKPTACVMLVVTAAGFVFASATINQLTGRLAPTALAIIFFLSLTKSFTSTTPFFFRLPLPVAPAGAAVADKRRPGFPPL